MVVDVGFFENLASAGSAYPSGPSGGKSLASYFDEVQRRPFEAPEGIGSYYSSHLQAPISYTDYRSQRQTAYQPVGPPQRFQANLLGGRPEDSILESAPGRFLLGQPTPVQDRTTSVDFMGQRVATTPVDFQNFATYAREAQLSLITSALGHRGQAPDEGLGRPKAAPDHTTEDIATNLGQLDFKGVMDNIIDGFQTVGETVFGPFDAFTRTVRNDAARNRAEAVAELFATGRATPSLVQFVSHLFDLNGLTQYSEVAKRAAEAGKTDVELIAELYDLSPATVAAIRDHGFSPTSSGLFGVEFDPAHSDWLYKATANEPFSYNEIVNLIAEFGLMMVPFGAVAKGAGYLARASRLLRGSTITAADAAAGVVRGGEAGVTLVGDIPLTRLYKLAVPGKPLLTAERIGSWSMQRAWRVMNAKPTRIAGAVTGFSPTGMRIGAGIRFGEWALKQIALNLGDEEAVATMDRWLWEQPLSTSPGLQIVDAFRVAPTAELKGAITGARRAYAHVAGRGDVPINPRLGRNLGALKDIPLPDLQRLVLDRLDWPADFMERVFGEGGPLSVDDLRNGLFNVALQVVRARHEARLRRFHTGLGAAERFELFLKEYGPEAADVLRDELRGRTHHIADAIRDEFWTRAEITDASELGGVGQIGPYHGYSAATRFVSWLHFSKWFSGVAEGAYVAKLRRDVNLDFLRAFRDEIAKAYQPADLVSAADLNRLLTYVPRAGDPKVLGGIFARFGGGRAVPRISRVQLETMLAELERLQGSEATERVYAHQTPRLTEAAAADPAAIGTAFGLGTDTVEALLGGNLEGPIPGDLERLLERTRTAARGQMRQQPELWWEKAATWLKTQIKKAQRTERIMAAGERLSDAVAERMPGEARRSSTLASIRTWMTRGTREYQNPRLEEEAVVERHADERLADDLERVFANPAAKIVLHGPDGLRPWQLEPGVRYVIESPTFDWRTANRIERLAAEAAATPGLDPVSAATLVDPALRSIERVEALKAARAAGWTPGSAADLEAVDALPSLDEAYGVLADTYLERETGTPVTAADVGRLESKARDVQAALTDITGKIAMRAILHDPARPVSPEVESFRERGAAFGVTLVPKRLGKATRGEKVEYAEYPNWYDLPLEKETTVRVSHETEVELRRTRLMTEAQRTRAELEAVEEQARRAAILRGQQAQREWYTWDRENPVGTFPTQKAAVAAAGPLREAGEALIVEKIRAGRWALVRGTLKEEVAARLAPEPAPEPASAALLSTEEVAAASGTTAADLEAQSEALRAERARALEATRARVSPDLMARADAVADATSVGPKASPGRVLVDKGRDGYTAIASRAGRRDTSAFGVSPDDAVRRLVAHMESGGDGPSPDKPTPGEIVQAQHDEYKAAIKEIVDAGERTVGWTRADGWQRIISPDTRKPGQWRVTSVMPDGTPFGHSEHKTFAEAVEALRQSEGDRIRLDNAEEVAPPAEESPALRDQYKASPGRVVDGQFEVDPAARAAIEAEMYSTVSESVWYRAVTASELARIVEGTTYQRAGRFTSLAPTVEEAAKYSGGKGSLSVTAEEMTALEAAAASGDKAAGRAILEAASQRSTAEPGAIVRVEVPALSRLARLGDGERVLPMDTTFSVRREGDQIVLRVMTPPEGTVLAPADPGAAPPVASVEGTPPPTGMAAARTLAGELRRQQNIDRRAKSRSPEHAAAIEALEKQIDAAMADVPVPARPEYPMDVDPRLPAQSEYISALHPDIINPRILRTPPDARPPFVFTFDSIYRVVGWDDAGRPVVQKGAGLANPEGGPVEPVTTAWRPATSSDFVRFAAGYGPTYDLYRQFAQEFHAPDPAPPPPLIVERIDETQRQADAELAAFDAEQEARQQAFAAHAAEWPTKVRLPGGAVEPAATPTVAALPEPPKIKSNEAARHPEALIANRHGVVFYMDSATGRLRVVDGKLPPGVRVSKDPTLNAYARWLAGQLPEGDVLARDLLDAADEQMTLDPRIDKKAPEAVVQRWREVVDRVEELKTQAILRLHPPGEGTLGLEEVAPTAPTRPKLTAPNATTIAAFERDIIKARGLAEERATRPTSKGPSFTAAEGRLAGPIGGDPVVVDGTKYRVRTDTASMRFGAAMELAEAGPNWRKGAPSLTLGPGSHLTWDERAAVWRVGEASGPASIEWQQRVEVLSGILHGIETGRWGGLLIAAVMARTPAELSALVDRVIADNAENGVNIGNASRWFTDHAEELIDAHEGMARPAAAAEPPPAAPPAAEVTFLDPETRAPIPARVVLVDAADVLTSADQGFPQNLQPRSREGRVTSDEQIKAIAAEPKPELLLGVDSGGDRGMPVVTAEGAVLAGNGRVLGLRLASRSAYGGYRAGMEAKLAQYGYTPADIAGMDRPVLVRLLGPMDDATLERLAWQLNSLPPGELAAKVATKLTPELIGTLKMGDRTSLEDALSHKDNIDAAVKILEALLPPDWVANYREPSGALNNLGKSLIVGAAIAKIIRADDLTLPYAAERRRVIVAATETGEGARLWDGLMIAATPLLKAREKVRGTDLEAPFEEAVDYLVRGIDLLLGKIRPVKAGGEGMTLTSAGIALRTGDLFAEFAQDPIAKHAGYALTVGRSDYDVARFIRGVVEAATNNVGEGLFTGQVGAVKAEGLLSSGVAALNIELKKANATEIDPFPSSEYPYDTPLTGTRELPDGQTAPPVVRTQPLAPEEVGPEIEARTVGEEVVYDIDSLAALYDRGGLGASVAAEGTRIVGARAEDVALGAAMRTDPEAVLADIRGLVAEYEAIDRSAAAGPAEQTRVMLIVRRLIDEANLGIITPGRWAFLTHALAGRFRRAEDGRINSEPMVRWAIEYDRIVELAEDARRVEFVDAPPEGAAVVIRRAEQRPLTPEQLADDLGPDVPAVGGADAARAAEIAASSAHTLVVNGSPGLTRALRAAVGAPAVTDATRAIYEFNARETMAQADQLDAARAKARAAVEEAERALTDFEANPPLEASETAAVLDERLTDMWVRLMTGSGLDPLGGAWGDSRPQSLGSVVSAIESIDNGVIVDPSTGVGLTPAEAAELRTALVAIADANLARHAARLNIDLSEARLAQLRRQRAPRGPEADFEPGAARDELAGLMDQVKPLIVTNPDLPPLEGFMGTQYVPSLPPGGTADAPISPRILYRDYMSRADDILPGLKEELAVGRMMEWGERVARSRFLRVMDAIVGPRPEKQIRANAIENLRNEIVARAKRTAPEGLSEEVLKEIDKVVERAFVNWRDAIEEIKLGSFRLFRRIDLVGRDILNNRFAEAVAEVYGKYGTEYLKRDDRPNATTRLKNPPEWYAELEKEGWDAWRLWRRSDNRVRQSILNQHTKLSDAIEALYGRAADFGMTKGGRWLTVMYQVLRFTGEVRWLALEALEPYALMAPQGGVRAAAVRPGVGPRVDVAPLGFGRQTQEGAFAAWAHWAGVSDVEQVTLLRERMAVREVARRQAKEFPKLLEELLTRDAGLRRMLRDLGDTPARFLERLDRDWRLAEESTRKVSKPEAEALLKPWLAEGIITPKEYAAMVDSGRITMHPAIEAELKATVDNPVAQALYKRLAALNATLFHDATVMFFGQENRSNLQRVLNHPLLWWPVSYQIKATKWLLRFMTEEAFGMDTRAMTGWAMQEVYDEHVRRYREDPDYRASIAAHRNVAFLSQMLLPIVPWDVGVSLSPWSRMVIDPSYERDNGVFGWGMLYTFTNLVPGLLHELTGGSDPDADPYNLRRLAPRHITLRSGDRPTSRSEAGEAPPQQGGVELPEEPEIRFR